MVVGAGLGACGAQWWGVWAWLWNVSKTQRDGGRLQPQVLVGEGLAWTGKTENCPTPRTQIPRLPLSPSCGAGAHLTTALGCPHPSRHTSRTRIRLITLQYYEVSVVGAGQSNVPPREPFTRTKDIGQLKRAPQTPRATLGRNLRTNPPPGISGSFMHRKVPQPRLAAKHCREAPWDSRP